MMNKISPEKKLNNGAGSEGIVIESTDRKQK